MKPAVSRYLESDLAKDEIYVMTLVYLQADVLGIWDRLSKQRQSAYMKSVQQLCTNWGPRKIA
jgi:hypothetical protein